MEEHRVISRNGVTTPGLLNAPGVPPSRIDPLHPDDLGREDVIALGPSETVVLYRNFRTFNGPYVAHCHNLAHEDHAMMFGWKLLK
jgi:FtsP/CotA-like multicopper oxidase with cupredoxin domain